MVRNAEMHSGHEIWPKFYVGLLVIGNTDQWKVGEQLDQLLKAWYWKWQILQQFFFVEPFVGLCSVVTVLCIPMCRTMLKCSSVWKCKISKSSACLCTCSICHCRGTQSGADFGNFWRFQRAGLRNYRKREPFQKKNRPFQICEKACRCHRVTGGKKCDIVAPFDKFFGQVGDNPFGASVLFKMVLEMWICIIQTLFGGIASKMGGTMAMRMGNLRNSATGKRKANPIKNISISIVSLKEMDLR